MENLEIRIEKSLKSLNELLECDNYIDLPYLKRDAFLRDMREIVKTELNKEVFNYSNEVLHIIYKKKKSEHRAWLDTFEIMVRDALLLN